MKDVIVVCDDLFGLEVCSILEQINQWNIGYWMKPPYNLLGYISDAQAPFGDAPHSVKRLGGIRDWAPAGEEKYVLAITDPKRKQQLAAALKAAGFVFETVFAPWTVTAPVEVGEGCVIAAYSIKPGMHIGDFVTVMDSMLTSHSVGDYSTIMRFANITGDVGKFAFVGNHAYSHLGKSIGDYCRIRDGAVLVKNAKEGAVMAGVPAVKVKKETA